MHKNAIKTFSNNISHQKAGIPSNSLNSLQERDAVKHDTKTLSILKSTPNECASRLVVNMVNKVSCKDTINQFLNAASSTL